MVKDFKVRFVGTKFQKPIFFTYARMMSGMFYAMSDFSFTGQRSFDYALIYLGRCELPDSLNSDAQQGIAEHTRRGEYWVDLDFNSFIIPKEDIVCRSVVLPDDKKTVDMVLT
jgi:hypothetical protein